VRGPWWEAGGRHGGEVAAGRGRGWRRRWREGGAQGEVGEQDDPRGRRPERKTTLDNAGNNNAACDMFIAAHKYELMLDGVHFHVRCCARILNILVQDGMAIIHEGIKKI
jgi:hypothetical protein